MVAFRTAHFNKNLGVQKGREFHKTEKVLKERMYFVSDGKEYFAKHFPWKQCTICKKINPFDCFFRKKTRLICGTGLKNSKFIVDSDYAFNMSSEEFTFVDLKEEKSKMKVAKNEESMESRR